MTTYNALASDHDLGGVKSMKRLQRLLCLDAGTDCNRRSLVALGPLSVPFVNNLDVLEAMGVDNESTPTDAPAQEVMASVSDNETEVVLLGEFDALLDVGCGLSHDGQHGIVTQGACVGRVGCWPAGVVGEVGPEASCRQFDPVVV